MTYCSSFTIIFSGAFIDTRLLWCDSDDCDTAADLVLALNKRPGYTYRSGLGFLVFPK